MNFDLGPFKKYNHYYFKISDRTNRALCIIMTLLLAAYSLIGVVLFSTAESFNPIGYISANLIWLAISVIVLLKYTGKPYIVIGLYMMVVGTDRILSWSSGLYDGEPQWLMYLELIFSVWMFVSGFRMMIGRLLTRYPSIVYAVLLTLIDLVHFEDFGFQFIGEMDSTMFMSFLSGLIRFLFYVFLVCILVCNDNPSPKDGVTQT